MSVELAKLLIAENSKVKYGIFGIIESSGCFPTKHLLNQFFEAGYDPCDQDQRMDIWEPFTLDDIQYQTVCMWWMRNHPNTIVSDLGTANWGEWSSQIIELDC